MPAKRNLSPVRLPRTLSYIAKFALFCIVALSGGFLLYKGHELIETDQYFKLEEIRYFGAQKFNEEAFDTLFAHSFEPNLLTLDINRVRSLVEAEAWVESALVRRKLPDQLLIYVTEREPRAIAAIDDALFVVDREGIVLDSYGADYAHLDTPIIKGLSNLARENSVATNAEKTRVYLEVLEEMQREPLDHSGSISEIDVRDPDRVAVVPSDEPVAIYLGSSEFRRRYETFLGQKQLYDRLKKKYGLIEYVDVTYEDKIIFHTPNESVAG